MKNKTYVRQVRLRRNKIYIRRKKMQQVALQEASRSLDSVPRSHLKRTYIHLKLGLIVDQ